MAKTNIEEPTGPSDIDLEDNDEIEIVAQRTPRWGR
jgi:hypothetical protein